MAVLDSELGAVVVRVVYDGPPFSGKTTSLRSLSRMLAERRRSEVFSPEEVAGRTMYFDWMEYVGGLIAGWQVRCQIVSVPGQRALEARRRFLLTGADAVVFVADSTPTGLEASTLRFAELEGLLARGDDPPVGVVVQANKRDLELAVPLAEIRARFGARSNLGVVEAVASNGLGVRESFVFAVRLALDRARYLMQVGRLPTGKPEIESGKQLQAQVAAVELGDLTYDFARASIAAARAQSSSGPGGRKAPLDDGGSAPAGPPARRDPDQPPMLPGASIPSGLVWPPVSGRVLLHELGSAGVQLERATGGHWMGTADSGWLLRSRAAEVYLSQEEGRRALLEQARLHTSLRPLLSVARGLALAEDGMGSWRLWSLLRRERSVREALIGALTEGGAQAGERVLDLARRVESAASAFPGAVLALPVGLDTVAASSSRPEFIDFLPAGGGATSPGTLAPERVGRLFSAQAEELLRHEPLDTGRLAGSLRGAMTREPGGAELLGPLLEVLEG